MITMSEDKIKAAAEGLYLILMARPLGNTPTIEWCEDVVRKLQLAWQDTNVEELDYTGSFEPS